MSGRALLILGTGDQASVHAHAASAAGIPVAGFLGRSNRRAPADLYVEVDCADPEAIRRAAHRLGARRAIAAFGDNFSREEASQAALQAGLDLATLIHPTALIESSATVADGVFVALGARIAGGAQLERGALVNSAAVVEHDCIVGAFAAIFSGAVLGGGVVLGPRAAVGLGAVVLSGVVLGPDCVAGAGAIVTRDQPPLTIVTGAPARVTRSRAADEPYVS